MPFSKDDRVIGKTIAKFDDIVARIERQDCQIAMCPSKLCQNCDMRACATTGIEISGARKDGEICLHVGKPAISCTRPAARYGIGMNVGVKKAVSG